MNNIHGANKDNLLIICYERDRGVFERMDALGLEFMGPQHPAGVRSLLQMDGLRIQGTFRPTIRRGDRPPPLRASWTTCSPPWVSTTRCEPGQ